MNKNHNKAKQTRDNDDIDWIVPPGLKNTVDDFVELYERMYSLSASINVRKKPLLICGATGVGKSMFTHIFQTLYTKEYGGKVVTLNCASIPRTLIISELFGYKEGSFTGARKDKIGLLKLADGGLLILEEIGELKKSDQATLLTFLENGGRFYPLGGDEEDISNVQIISTTNKPKKKFRPDFWSRFFQLYVPALYERRLDILYFLYEKKKDILKTLDQRELFAFLAYDWPGNVREIENISFLIEWKDKFREHLMSSQDRIDETGCFRFSVLDGFSSNKKYYPFNIVEMHRSFLQNAEKYLYSDDFTCLESFLNRYGFSVYGYNTDLAFPENINIEVEINQKLKVKIVKCNIFENYQNGLDNYSKLFLLHPLLLKKNLFDIKEKDKPSSIHEFPIGSKKVGWKKEDYELQKKILNYRKGTKINDGIESDFSSMSEKELLREMYTKRLDFCGTINKAAKSLGLSPTTFRGRLQKKYPDLFEKYVK